MPRPKQLLQAAPRVADPASVGLISPNLNGAPLPRLDTTAAIQPAMGMARIGEGVERLGEAATRLYEKKEKADSVTAEMRSAEVLENAYQKIAIRTKEEQDQSKWQSIGEEELNNAQVELDKIPNVPPEAKQAIQHKYNMASLQVRGGLKTKAIEKSFQDADKSADAIIDRAGRTEDMQLGVSAIDGMVATGLWPKEVGEDKKLKLGQHVEQTAQERQKQGFLTAVQINPEKALGIANDPKYGVTPEFRAWAQHTATAGVRAQTAATVDELNAHVDSGEFVAPEQVDAYKKSNPKVTDEMANNAKKNINALNSAAHQQWKVNNSDTNIARAMGAVRGYDPKTDPDMKQYDALNSWIHRNLVTGDEGVASTALKSRLAGKAAPEEKDPRMKDVTEKLDFMLGRGDFGVFKTPSIRTVEQGEGKDTITLHKQVTLIDLKKQAAAEDARVKVEAHMRGYMKQYPNANQSQLLTEMTRVTPGHLTAGALDQLDGVSSPMQTPPGSLSMASPAEGPLQQPETVTTGKKEPLPEDPGRAPKAQVVPDETVPKGAAVDDNPFETPDTFGPTDIHATPGTVSSESLRASLPAPLKPHADDFKEAAEENGLDPRFLAAISMFETGNGTSGPFRKLNNAMGISNKHGATAQASVRDSIFKMARSLANPKGPYRKAKTVDEIAAIYSPPGAENDPNGTNSEWPDAVKRNLRHLKKA